MNYGAVSWRSKTGPGEIPEGGRIFCEHVGNKSFPRRARRAIVALMNGTERDEGAAFEDWEQRPLSERASAPAPYLAELNPAQQAAGAALDGPVPVLAGAGTGQTRVLTPSPAPRVHHPPPWPHPKAGTDPGRAATMPTQPSNK